MTTRPLDLLDLPTLYHYRAEVISLDTARLLTRGNPLSAAGMMAYLNPARHIYTAVHSEAGMTLLGGVVHTPGDSFAKLLYLAPAGSLTHPGLPSLIDNLSREAGNWGAYHLLAEVDEDSEAFPALRAAGFSVYAWQRIWDMSAVSTTEEPGNWMKPGSSHLSAIQSLHYQIVPPLLQPIEPAPRKISGLICAEGLRCYAAVSSGLEGILLTPLIHPEATHVPKKLSALLQHLPRRSRRPIYLCVRSYQAWLEPVLEDLGAKASPRQAVMVKHLARLVKDEQLVRASQPATAIPASRISRIQTKREK